MSEYIKKIKIGDIELKNNIFLAPMAGITDLPFRHICKKFNPGLMYTEMVSAKGLVYEDIKTNKMLTISKSDSPIAVQIFGSDPDDIKKAILKLNDIKEISIIDINMGCPAPKVTKNGDGAALLKDLKLVEEIIKSAILVSKKPITVKTRIGYKEGEITAIEIAKMCERYGVKAITIHGRSKDQMYTGKANLDIIKEVRKSVSNILVIGNGDVVDYESAMNMFKVTNVDGIMVARGALGKPWVFKDILNKEQNNVPNDERLNIILEHINLAVDYYGEKRAVPELRKHIAWYLKGLKNSSYVKDLINKENSKDRVIDLLKEYFKRI